MCLATPGRIVSVAGENPELRIAEVDFGPVRKSAQLLYVPEATVGDYVIVQAGFAIRRVPEEEARTAMEYAAQLAAMDPDSSTPSGREAPFVSPPSLSA
jgi:hydrogenase expression/formation protein HypC